MKIINAPSLANCSFLEMGFEIAELVAGGVSWFHVDIMDGHYVPNLCFPLKLIHELKSRYPSIAIDVHLMVDTPAQYLEQLRDAGADWVSFHLDATSFSRRMLAAIHSMGMKAGIVLNPSQRVDSLEPLVDFIDYAVLMTVEPGYAGQTFLPDSLSRVAELATLRSRYQRSFLISIDGGIDYPNAIECARLGAEVFVTGIYTVFNQHDSIAQACVRFTQTLENALCSLSK